MSDGRPTDLTSGPGSDGMYETAVHGVFLACALVSILTTIGIVLALLGDTLLFFGEVSPVAFFTATEWHPTIRPFRFGVLPLVMGTLTITLGAAAVALPIGTLTAIYLSEYASDQVRGILKPTLEVLAGVPTVVYGWFALVYLTPALATVFPAIETFNALSASIIVGVMIIPMVSSISEDAMSAVPDDLREAGYGLGATKFDVSTGIVVPAAVSGIISSFILALSRAIGETMAVTLAAGRDARMVNPFDPASYLGSVETMTAAIVELGTGDVAGTSTAYRSLFAIGITLFAMTLVMNLVSDWISSRYREVYE